MSGDFGYHKAFQRAYNLQHEHDDIFQSSDFVILKKPQEIIQAAIDYFQHHQKELLMPSKSIAVAIIYAALIEKHFGIPLRESLNDLQLFCGNDRFFTPYSESPEIYEAVLLNLNAVLPRATLAESLWNHKLEQVQKTLDYFYEEFGLVKPEFAATIS